MADVTNPQGWIAEPDLHVAKVQIRSDREIKARLTDALGLAPPDRPNQEVRREGLACASIAPGEWLLTGTETDVAEALARVRSGFADDLCLAIDLTAGRFASIFSGPEAVAFITSYSPLDVNPARFPTGAAARTQLGDIGLYLTRLDDRPSFRLIIDQSQLPYFRYLLGLDRAEANI